LKNAEKLLAVVPDHPDTMSMYALFLFHSGEEDKGLAQAKAAVFKSKMKSQMCWHTYGMLLHQKRDYQEAIKCYQFALKTDPNNVQIMRDTALMQIQIRDHVGHTHSRFEMLKHRPNLLQNWLAYCLANHMKGEFADVLKSLGSIETLLINANMRRPEISSYNIYRCLVYEHAGQYPEFYAELKKTSAKILDRVVYREMLVRACAKLNKDEEAR
jgi:tetratricopeptide (TPR) repeat protein